MAKGSPSYRDTTSRKAVEPKISTRRTPAMYRQNGTSLALPEVLNAVRIN